MSNNGTEQQPQKDIVDRRMRGSPTIPSFMTSGLINPKMGVLAILDSALAILDDGNNDDDKDNNDDDDDQTKCKRYGRE